MNAPAYNANITKIKTQSRWTNSYFVLIKSIPCGDNVDCYVAVQWRHVQVMQFVGNKWAITDPPNH